MSSSPDRNAIIERYNQGCTAFQAAATALQQGNLERYEVEMRAAATGAIGALEWAVRFYLEHHCASELPPAALANLAKTPFPSLLQLLATTRQPLAATIRDRFKEHRALRNHTEHGATIPANRAVRIALADVRRFLVDRLLVQEEQLRLALAGEPAPVPPAPPPDQAPALSTIGEHRELGCKPWLDKTIAEGIARARKGYGDRYDATIDSLACEAKELLTRDAVALIIAGNGPTDGLPVSQDPVEEEMQRLLKGDRGGRLGASEVDRLRRLLPLLTRRTSLCVEAGWFEQQEDGVSFSVPQLASLCVGARIATQPKNIKELRRQVGTRRDWAEAAWAATASGDSLSAWSELLLAETPSATFLERVVATCAAFGGARPGAVISEAVLKAFRTCVSALAWFPPRRMDVFDHPKEQDSPWFIALHLWRRCIMDLAHLAHLHADEPRFMLDLDAIHNPPSPLGQILAGLGLALRMTDEVATALLALCSPQQAARQGRLGESFFKAIITATDKPLFDSEFTRTWLLQHGISALWSADSREAARVLTVPSDWHPAGFLLNQREFLPQWTRAWDQFVQHASSEEIGDAWARSLRLLSERDDEPTLQVVAEGFDLINKRGILPAVSQRLRKDLQPISTDPESSSTRLPVKIEILRRATLAPSDLAGLVEEWTDKPALAWQTMLQAGTPDVAIARWCVTKLVAAQTVPKAYRDGPVGILMSPAATIMQQGPWQLAFQQAHEALQWLLDQGSADALSVIADACFAPRGEKPLVDPVMGKLAGFNLSVPLSQVIWGRVLARKEGRAALCMLVERGKAPGGMNYFEEQKNYVFEDILWIHAAVHIAGLPSREQTAASSEQGSVRADRKAPSSGVRAEAERLLACFEKRVQLDPTLARLNGRAVHEMMAALVADCGVDVSAVVATLLREIIMGSVLGAEAAQSCWALGIALRNLLMHHPTQAAPLLNEALVPQVLTLIRSDNTSAFWGALLLHHGATRVLSAITELDGRDIGLGFFDALLEINEPILRERHLRPELMRSTLLRSVEGRFTPESAFFREAWRTERAHEEVPEIVRLADGDWLTHLLAQSTAWSSTGRCKMLRQLALYSSDIAVRQRCIAALCDGK